MKILTIGNDGAYEAKTYTLVADILSGWGHEVLFYKHDLSIEGSIISFESDCNIAKYLVCIDGIDYNIEDFDTIWYLKPYPPKVILNYEPAKYRLFLMQQFFALRQGIWSVFKHKIWLNNPWAMFIAENKIYQLQKAQQIGLLIPNTLATSEPEKVKKFYEENEKDIIVKIIASTPMVNEVIFTNKVTDDYMELIDSLRYSPAIFQSNIKKRYELRITIVGNKVFPVKIESQNDPELKIDWRRKPEFDDYDVKMGLCEIPNDIELKILKLMSELDLRFGCVDMIVDVDGNYVFLEVNPNGQWYFIQTNTGIKIAEEIAKVLVGS